MEESVAARKVQKADREKLRRDRLNEQFAEMGNVLDPDRPKNDKGTILTDTIQLIKDLNAQVDKLKADYSTLTEESRELTQEKNDLREEKASLKSDIENLNLQYQQRLRASFPWGAMDHSVVMAPPPYPYPVPVPVPPGTMPIHPSMQPYPYFANQNPGVIPNSFSAFMPHMASMEHHSTQYVPPAMHPVPRAQSSNKQDAKHNSQKDGRDERSEDSNDVATELELKTPGSKSDQGSVSVHKKSKKASRKENSILGEDSSSRCSSRSAHDSSSNSVVGGSKPDA
ncbi:unnamed protein product [Rhodiola kirilowii]